MHLAYYCRIPQLAFFHATDTYFSPPGLDEAGGRYFFHDAEDHQRLRAALGSLLGL